MSALAASPGPEQLLPDDTLVLATTPSFAQLRQVCLQSPKGRLWNDPALKPLRDKFLARWREEFIRPLERDLGIRFDSWNGLFQGQLTFAVTRSGWQGVEAQPPGVLFLADAQDKAATLRTNLAGLRTKWIAAGRRFRSEKIRNLDFMVLPLTTNDMPRSVVKLLWHPPVFPQLSGGEDVTQAPTPDSSSNDTLLDMLAILVTANRELVVGQAGSMLVAGNSVREVEKVVTRLTGGARPTLGDVAAYQACARSQFSGAPFYGWVNIKAIVEAVAGKRVGSRTSEPSDPLEMPKADRVVALMGLRGCRSLAFSVRDAGDGALFQVFLSAPESARAGVVRLLAQRARDAAPPPFVPADASQFFRWRIEGPRTWASLGKLLNDISPQALSGLNTVLNTADARAKLDDPGFDLKQTLLATLGDDIIRYDRAPRGKGALQSAPAIVLLGSPEPELLAVALKRLFIVLPEGNRMTEREFLGRRVFSVPVPPVAIFPAASPQMTSLRMLYWAASGSYVALANDAALLEEQLRASQGQRKALRDTVGLLEAAQTVGGMRTGFFGYENDADSMRAAFGAARTGSGADKAAPGPSLFPGLPGVTGPEESLTALMDFSRLPAFDTVAPYFGFTLFALSANTEGLTFRVFSPTPQSLRGGAVAKASN